MHYLLSAILTASPACARTVTVDATSGAPRILVDGEPVRSRMFFGGGISVRIEMYLPMLYHVWVTTIIEYVRAGTYYAINP